MFLSLNKNTKLPKSQKRRRQAVFLVTTLVLSNLALTTIANAQEYDPDWVEQPRISQTLDLNQDGIADVVIYDTDGDGRGDYVEEDTDGDGIVDSASTDPRYIDNIIEETDPYQRDTDGDGITDGQEIEEGTNVGYPEPEPWNPNEGYDDGYDSGGYDSGGYDSGGYDSGGYDSGGYDSGGYDSGGYDSEGY
jgi:uncharacterized membrane protein YgcG